MHLQTIDAGSWTWPSHGLRAKEERLKRHSRNENSAQIPTSKSPSLRGDNQSRSTTRVIQGTPNREDINGFTEDTTSKKTE